MELRLTHPIPRADVDAIISAVARSSVLILYENGENGSGVLVEVESRFFVFTAAHCVADGLPRFMLPIEPEGVGLDLVELSPVHGGGWTLNKDNGPDAGVVEVSTVPHGREWLSKRAVKNDAIAAFTVLSLGDEPLPIAMSGMPAEQTSELLPGQRRHVGLIAETKHAVECVDGNAPCRLPCLISEMGIDPSTQEVVGVPNLAGMSGGATWISADTKAFLIGTHQGRADLLHGSQRKPTALTTLVSAHLAVLAGGAPELSASILAEWPAVSRIDQDQDSGS